MVPDPIMIKLVVLGPDPLIAQCPVRTAWWRSAGPIDPPGLHDARPRSPRRAFAWAGNPGARLAGADTVLVDTSVWVDHLRRGNEALAQRLRESPVWVHPFVIGELACGGLRRRAEVLALLTALPHVPVVDQVEALEFLESQGLFGLGLGWVDVHLLASARLARCGVWTLDRRLQAAARRLDLLPDLHRGSREEELPPGGAVMSAPLGRTRGRRSLPPRVPAPRPAAPPGRRPPSG